jgi:hypothetical protein
VILPTAVRLTPIKSTDDQIAALKETVRRQLCFLGGLRDRMNRLGFAPDDRLYVHVTAAWNAVQALHVEIHYLGCKSGVGR